MQENLNHVMEFSGDGKLFAYIDDSGKLKIWDTENNQLKQEYVPNLHLASPITCLKWIEVGEKRTGKKKKQKKEFVKLYLVLGTSNGKVVLYSYAEGQIEREFQGTGHSDSVTDLFYDDGSETVYSCGADAKVVKWGLVDGGKELQAFQAGKQKLTAIAVIENYVIVASRGIKVWDLESESCVKTFTGHSGVVTSVKTFTHDSHNYFLTVSRTERVISLWCLDMTSKKSDAVGSFVTDDSVHQVSLNVFNDQITLTAVNRVGIVHMYVQDLNKIRVAKPVKQRLNLQIVSEADKDVSEPIPIVACVIGVGDNELLVAYGDRMLLKFENIQPDQSTKENILVRQNPKKFSQKSEQKPHNVVVPLVEAGQVEYLNEVTASKKDLKPVDTPLMTRLENMSIGKTLDAPAAKNMARLLVQGLHSKDANILRTVFQTTDPDAIQSTLTKLPPAYVQPLVNELSLLMQMKTTHVQSSVVWLKMLIQTQMSQLMALGADKLKDIFGTCLGVIDHRLQNLPDLMMLTGRVDLIATQMTKKSINDVNDVDLSELLVYEDKSDDEDNLPVENSDGEHYDWDDESGSEEQQDEEMNVDSDSHENLVGKKKVLKSSSDEEESKSEMDTD